MRTSRLLIVFALGSALTVAACRGADTPTAPSQAPAPTPAPSPSPAPAPAPAPAPNGSSLALSPQTIQGQGQSQGTVTLPNAAPAGGALVQLTSDIPTVARVPASVIVPQGSRSASFLIETSTVATATPVRITATYSGTTLIGTLTVMPPTLTASFVVRSKTRGLGACAADFQGQELDCVLDASSSQGFVSAYLWTLTMGPVTLHQTAAAPNAIVSPQGTGCQLYQQGTGGDGPNGERYLKMEVALQVRDGFGVVTDVVRQQVKVFPNQQCGFSY